MDKRDAGETKACPIGRSDEIAASGDAREIAAAIRDLAAAVREFTDAFNAEVEVQGEPERRTYMDGTPIDADD